MRFVRRIDDPYFPYTPNTAEGMLPVSDGYEIHWIEAGAAVQRHEGRPGRDARMQRANDRARPSHHAMPGNVVSAFARG